MVSEDASIFMPLGNYAKIVPEYPSEIRVCFLSWASLVAQLVKNPSAMQETPVPYLVGKIPWRRDRLPTSVFLDFCAGLRW